MNNDTMIRKGLTVYAYYSWLVFLINLPLLCTWYSL